MTQETELSQAVLWNGAAGQAWVENQDLMDHMLAPFEQSIVEALPTRVASHVLDVGCGTGSTTLAVARHVGDQGSVLGIDISEPMVNEARRRARAIGSSAGFLCADAQRYAFAAARFDAIVSRFGVMFFDDPVAAFANLHRAVRSQASLHVITWRSAEENPFMTTAERAAAPLLPNLPARQPDAPGQFAFARPARVQHILAESGWQEIELEALDVVCTFPARELVRYFTRMGPLGRVLGSVDADTRAEVIARVSAAFVPFAQGDSIRFPAACWAVQARAGAKDC